MNKTNFLSSLQANTNLIGTLVTIPAPEVAELLALAGFDWLFLDMEHGNLSLQMVQQMCQAVAGKCHPLVRVPENDGYWIKKVLDIGSDGIIVPHVNSREEVAYVLQHAHYPPEGSRSVGSARAQGYGLHFGDYVSTANRETAIIIQIEDIKAVQNLDEILAVPGISGVLIGPYDLSGSMNLLGQVTHPAVQAEIQKIKATCKAAQMPYGIYVANAEAAQRELKDGCNFIAVGSDSGMLGSRATEVLERMTD